MIKIRKSNDRGFANHGWLKSWHTFSFASYFDKNHMSFGNLRVINEDKISGGTGFDQHPHNNMEIITYVISGALSHQDSMGNSSTILPGEVQIMSAGTGVFHSEFNHEKNQETHLLQIWILPKKLQVTPRYNQKSFASEFSKNDLTLVVSGLARDGSIEINQDAEIFIGKFTEPKMINFAIKKDRKIWLQIIFGEMLVNDLTLKSGDSAAIENESEIKLNVLKNCEFLLFDL